MAGHREAVSAPSVLVLSSTLPRWESDTEPRFVLDLARALSARCRPVILAPMAPGAAPHEVMDGVEVRRFRYAPLRRLERLAAPGAIMPNLRSRPWLALLIPAFFLGQLIAVIKMLRGQRFDVVHCHWIIPQGLTMSICSLLMRTPPFLLTCHGTDVYALNGRWLRRLKKSILRRAGTVTVVSPRIGKFLAEEVDEDVAERCRHIPMGVDLDLFQRAGRRRPGARTRILYAGRLTESKGVEYLLRALVSPGIAVKDVQLRIAGNGPLRKQLEQMVARLGLSERVRFLGGIPHPQLARELAHATIFCLPSIMDSSGAREGMPTVLLEAAAASVPIIASDVGGCGDLVVPGHTGWLVPPADEQAIAAALLEAIQYPEEAGRMAAAAHDRVLQYSWTRIGARYAEELEALAAAGAR